MSNLQYNRIVFFDGVCNLCNASVNFIIKHDSKAKFKFSPLQSEKGKSLIKEYDLPEQLESIIFLEDGKVYTKSSAALRIAKSLNGFWPLLFIFYFVPKFIRDFIYNRIANNRYSWFGKKDICMVPTEDVKGRFL